MLSVLQAFLLFANGIAILNNDRFLEKCEQYRHASVPNCSVLLRKGRLQYSSDEATVDVLVLPPQQPFDMGLVVVKAACKGATSLMQLCESVASIRQVKLYCGTC